MASRVHMQGPSTLVEIISTQDAVLPANSDALLRAMPAPYRNSIVRQGFLPSQHDLASRHALLRAVPAWLA